MNREKILEDRGARYGDFDINMYAFTRHVEGIISQALQQKIKLPDRVGPLIMTAAKILREAYMHTEDNIDDGVNYLEEAGKI